MNEKGFRQLGERERLHGSFISVAKGTFIDPDGFTFERDIVRHPGAVCIVPIDHDGSLLLVRQYRAAIDHDMLEFPAGKLDVPGEDVDRCAQRELGEEIGRKAEHLVELGRLYNSPGFSDEATTCFLAQGLTVIDQALQGVEEQHLRVEALSWARFWQLVGSGDLSDMKTIAAACLAERAQLTRPFDT